MATPMLNCCSFKQGMYLPNGYGPTDSCPQIIGEYADILEAPDGTNIGDLVMIRYIDNALNQHIHLYTWDGTIWFLTIDSSSIYVQASNGFKDIEFAVNYGNWEFTYDEGATWQSGSVSLSAPYPTTLELWFRNIDNGCIYTNVPSLPLTDYCIDWAVIDIGAFWEISGSFNGVLPDNIPNMVATMIEPYQSVQGAIGGLFYQAGATTIYIQVTRPSDQPVTASLATILDFEGTPVPAVPTNTSCGSECYLTNFTPVDVVTNITLESITINGVDMNIAAVAMYVTEAGYSSAIISYLQSEYGVYDPTLAISIYTSGQTVYFQCSSMLLFTSLTWRNAGNTEGGPSPITTCL